MSICRAATRLPLVLGLAIALRAPVAGADAGVSAMPVPFPAATELPRQETLQSRLAEIDAFLRQADAAIQSLHFATSQYRSYVAQVQKMLASCELDFDLKGSENHPFRKLIRDEATQCREQVTAFKVQAQAYAARLDEAVAFAQQIDEAAAAMQRQRERVLMLRHARTLKGRVDEGFRTLDTSVRSLKPWMQ